MELKRRYVEEAYDALREGNMGKHFEILSEGLNFYGGLCCELINSVPPEDRGCVIYTMTQLAETIRKREPATAELERFIAELFQSITVAVPVAEGDDEDG